MNYAVILAGGTGTRVGANVPKQFIVVQGKPILAYTLDNFQADPEIDAIEIVCHKNWVSEIKKIVKTYGYSKVKWYTTGGATFQESTMNGIYHLEDKVSADDIAVISFAVSPFTTPDIINDSIRVAKEHGNGIASEDIPLCTCVKDGEGSSEKNLIRETIKGFSNPWTFRYGELLESYKEAEKRAILKDLEPHTTSVYFALGKRIWFSKSSGYNFKITTRADLDKFEGLLLLKKMRQEKA